MSTAMSGMSVDLFGHSFSQGQLLVFYLVALLVGMAKTGVHGAGMLSVPMLATVFGGQNSTGILLPVLCIADVLGLLYYHRHASWIHLRQLFPWAAAGTIIGTVVGGFIDDRTFRLLMATAIIGSVLVMIWLESSRRTKIPQSKTVARATGLIGGFTSMVGNLAGPLMAVYFLMMRLPKYVFIGTTAWFFLVMNFFKVPLHVFFWDTISWSTLLIDLTAIPAIVGGAGLGILIVRNLSEKLYRWLIIVMTLAAAIFMMTDSH
jgi:uncharacterized membrane protein YfcA